MSSAEDDDLNDGENASFIFADSLKKRRVQRACDTCRRKKIRCDGGQMPDNRCSNCVTYGFECTYIEAAKKRGPPKGYVESLENRLDKMEKLLEKICPDTDFSHELGGGRIDREAWQKGYVGASAPASGNAVLNATSFAYGDAKATNDDEGIVTLSLCEDFKSMDLLDRGARFFGKSSGAMLVQQALDLKKEATAGGSEDQIHHFNEPRYPWELVARNNVEPKYTFPDEDLGTQLVQLYFVHFNSVTPILHRPTFECKIMQGVHLRNSSLAGVYLMVCAVASRYSDDPRVFLDGVESTISGFSAGWKFFEQVRKGLLGPPCLEDLQTYCLSVMYLYGTSAMQASWTKIGIGIRMAQDVGAHRRKSYDGKLSVEGELWKRVFWALVVLDRQMSSSLGRPCAIQDEDFDLDLPVECDDEYWEHPDPEQAFKQPPGKPSTVAYFNSLIKLCNILSSAHRTIYSINKSKVLLGFVGPEWEQQVVVELDSSLNKWIDEVPDHLRWDPTRDASSLFFAQSTLLYANYYNAQIFIHRPFIPSPRKPSPLSFPSLAICTNAARSCSHMIDVYRKRANPFAPFLQTSAFTAGIVLLLNIWGGKQSGLSTDPVKEMADVHKCMAALKGCENRWHMAGRLWDVLYELASVGDLPLPQPSPPGGTKRERDDDGSPTLSSRTVQTTTTTKETPRPITGTRRVTRDAHSQSKQPLQTQSTAPQFAQSYDMPVYSNDLGRLPVHGQVNFATNGMATTTTAAMPPPSSSASALLSEPWFSSMVSVTPQQQQQPIRTASVPAPVATASNEYAVYGEAYSTDDLFLDQISSNMFGGFATQATPMHGAAAASHGAGLGPRSQVDSDSTNDMQAFMDAIMATATVRSDSIAQPHLQSQSQSQPQSQPHPLVIPRTANGMFDVDADTIAVWSSAPTSFGMNDWGRYLSSVNVSGDGGSGLTTTTTTIGETNMAHGLQQQWQRQRRL